MLCACTTRHHPAGLIPDLNRHFQASFQVAKLLLRGGVAAYTSPGPSPNRCPHAAAAASRVEISLPPSQLDRFVGSYSIATVTIPITRDGEHLMLHLPQQPAIQLLAMSPTQFFVKKPDLVLAFESDSTGRVTALTIQQLETKQRLVRNN